MVSQTAYQDMHHSAREAPAESLLAVLRALGAPIDNDGDINGAIEFRRQELRNRLIEPVIVAWDGKMPEVPLPYALELESGERESRQHQAQAAQRLPSFDD